MHKELKALQALQGYKERRDSRVCKVPQEQPARLVLRGFKAHRARRAFRGLKV